MKYIVTREITRRYEIDVEAKLPTEAVAKALAMNLDEWRLDNMVDSLADADPENEIDQQIMIATRVVRCSGCDGAFFDDRGTCTYCGLTHEQEEESCRKPKRKDAGRHGTRQILRGDK